MLLFFLPHQTYSLCPSGTLPRQKMDKTTKEKIEAAAFRGLVEHLQRRSDVQNIDLMNLAGFCRNCLSKWYSAEAKERGLEVDYESARGIVYGMPYAQWKSRFQTEATAEQLKKFDSKSEAP